MPKNENSCLRLKIKEKKNWEWQEVNLKGTERNFKKCRCPEGGTEETWEIEIIANKANKLPLKDQLRWKSQVLAVL